MYKLIRKYIRIVALTALLLCVFVFFICAVNAFSDKTLIIIAICVLMCLLSVPISFALSVFFSRKIVDRIFDYDLDNLKENEIYDELKPMASKILQLGRIVEKQQIDAFQRQEEYKTLTDNMSEGILIIDSDMKPLICNPIAMKLLEYKLDDDNKDEPRDIIMRSVKSAFGGNHAENKLHFEGKSYHLTANPVIQGDNVVGVAVIIIDETEIMASDQLRREFTANVSHELKTPLTSISGFAELMANGMVQSEDVSDFAANIYNEAQRLIVLVNDIIKLSEIEDDTHLYETSQVDLLEIGKDVVQRLQGAAARRNVSLSVVGESAVITGVEQILFEMMRNLCDNSIKYNYVGGKVEIKIENNKKFARFTVSDTGIGIPIEHQARIFERFYRVDKSHSKEIGGTGLGLSIVKHGAEYHDADISLESAADMGTKISITFNKKLSSDKS